MSQGTKIMMTDKQLSFIGAPWHIEKLMGQDRADVFAFALAVAAAAKIEERERCAKWATLCAIEWHGMANGDSGPGYDHRASAAQEIAADFRDPDFAKGGAA
jgi:hypothetical protein